VQQNPRDKRAKEAIRLPVSRSSPLNALALRIMAAVTLVLVVVTAVYLDRAGYRDVNEDGLTLLDCFYYSVVSLSTTGYGDITPVSETARLVNILLITPSRVLFLIILVGTTLEILTEQFRRDARITRWRKSVKDHVIVCGYGTKGRSAVSALVETGIDVKRIVVVEEDPAAAKEAVAIGLAVIEGSATRSAILEEARIKEAKTLIIAANRDDVAVLVALTARELTGGRVRIIAAVREAENARLLKQSGAHHVVVSSSTAGRLLGMCTSAPPLVDVVEDLLSPSHGMALAMRSARRDEVGRSPRELEDVVIALIRRGYVAPLTGAEASMIEIGDMLVYVRYEGSTTPAVPV